MSASRLALAALFVGQASAGWTDKAGACRKDVEGTTDGVKDTDFHRYNKFVMTVTDLAHCETLCAGWEAQTGVKCSGIEAQTKPSLHYCEIWVTEIKGKTNSADHVCNTYDGTDWIKGTGACRKDDAATDGGEKDTDYMKFDKAKDNAATEAHTADSVADCKEKCEKWGETNTGATCYGIEVLKKGTDDFDYCELWVTMPAGTEESAATTDHGCHLYEPDLIATGASAPKADPEDVSSATMFTALTTSAVMALTYGTM